MRQKTRVLIVGAGPVGQGLAIELGSRGINCLVVEKNSRIGVAPRAKTTNVRTREHLRRWGIAEALREASPFGIDYPSTVVFATRLTGHALARFENALNCAPGRNPLYAEHAQWIPQYTLEQVMRRHLDSFPGVQVRLEAMRLEAMRLERPRQWGACWLFTELWPQLRLDEFWRPLLPAVARALRGITRW